MLTDTERPITHTVIQKRSLPPAPFSSYLRHAVSNVISRLVFGPQARADIGQHSQVHHSLQVLMDGILYLMINPLYNIWPGCMNYFQTSRLKSILGADHEIRKYIDESIEQHEKTLAAEEEEPRDFIDAVIIERRKRPNEPSLSTRQIQQTILDLFGGGKVERSDGEVLARGM